jgi:predicted transposase/invertase (TIGR01784 family)
MKKFYANLFAKVFSYLDYNDPDQDWRALAVFEGRKVEPRSQPGYATLLESHHVHRIYLDELPRTEKVTPGWRILQLVTAPNEQTREIVSDLLDQSKRESSSARGQAIVQLVEELLMRRFTGFDRLEIRTMFKLHDLKESKVWKEAEQIGEERGVEKGIRQGREEGREEERAHSVRRLQARGMTQKEIAEVLGIPLADVRRLARKK